MKLCRNIPLMESRHTGGEEDVRAFQSKDCPLNALSQLMKLDVGEKGKRGQESVRL